MCSMVLRYLVCFMPCRSGLLMVETGPRRDSGVSRLFGIVAVLAAVVWTTWPLASNPAGMVMGAPPMETARHLWALWAGLRDGPVVIDTTLIDFPSGIQWVLADPINLLWFAPGAVSSGPTLGWNLVLVASLVLAGAGAWLLARLFGAPPVACWGAAVIAILLPPLNHGLHTGMTEGMAAGWTALACAALWSALSREGWGPAALAGVLLGACCWAGAYCAIHAALAGAALVLFRSIRGPSRLRTFVRALVVGGLAAAVGAPMVWMTMVSRGTELPGSFSAVANVLAAPDLLRNRMLGADPGAILLPSPWPHAVYLGPVLLVLALLGARRAPPLAAAAFTLLVFGLGYYLQLGGQAVRVGGDLLMLPAGVLSQQLDVLGRAARWHRAIGAAGVFLVPLAVLGFRDLLRRVGSTWHPPLWGVLCLAFGIEYTFLAPVGWPRPVLPEARGLAMELDEPGPILEVPLPSAFATRPGSHRDQALLAQVFHGHELAGDPLSGLRSNGRVIALAAVLNRSLEMGACAQAESSLDEIRAQGFRWLIVHFRRHGLDPDNLQACLGPPRFEEHGSRAWEL